MRKQYPRHDFAPKRVGKDRRVISWKEKVRRFYPAAKCDAFEHETTPEFCIMANNGTGNVLAVSTLTEDDAWRRAWTYIERRRP